MAQDPLTKKEFQPHRTNQRFESRGNQVKFNNLNAQKRRNAMAAINKPLNKNFQILSEIMADEKIKRFHKEFLIGKGFNLGIHTHYETYEGILYNAIYDYIIVPEDNKDYIKFIKK
jgi:hypothetical protein